MVPKPVDKLGAMPVGSCVEPSGAQRIVEPAALRDLGRLLDRVKLKRMTLEDSVVEGASTVEVPHRARCGGAIRAACTRPPGHSGLSSLNPRRSGVLRLLVLVLLAALLTVSCSDDNEPTAASSTVVTSPTTPTTRLSTTTTVAPDPADQVEADVVAAYRAASDAFLEAAAIPDPDFVALAETHLDPMLNQRRGVITELRFENRVIRLPEDSIHRIDPLSFELREPDVAVIEVCIVDDGERFDATTGALVTDGQPGTSRFEAALTRVDGRWLLTEQLLVEEWQGVAGCAVG